MCLDTFQKKPKTAHKNITVYKVLEKSYYSDDVVKYRAPFQPIFPNAIYKETFYYYEPGKVHKPVRKHEEKYYWSSIDKNSKIKEVGDGWLHAFLFKTSAELMAADRNRYYYHNCVVVQMTIPKGARYYESIGGFEICSDTLVWNE